MQFQRKRRAEIRLYRQRAIVIRPRERNDIKIQRLGLLVARKKESHAPYHQRLRSLHEGLRIVGFGELYANALRIRSVSLFHAERAWHVELGEWTDRSE